MNKLLHYMLFCLLTGLVFVSCRKNNVDGPTGPVITPLDTSALHIPVSQGQIGLIIDTRPIAKKGYKPAYISLSVTNGQSFSFSDDHVEVDAFTNLVIWRIPKDSVSEKDVEQFAKGIPVTIKVYDKEDMLLAELQENSLPVSTDVTPIEIRTSKPKIIPPLKIIAGIPYVIQRMPDETDQSAGIWTYAYNEVNASSVGGSLTDLTENPFVTLESDYIMGKNDAEDYAGQFFTFEKVGNDSTFYIKAKGKKDKYLFIHPQLQRVFVYDGLPANLPDDNYKFILSQDDEGRVIIKSYSKAPLKLSKTTFLGTQFDDMSMSAGIASKFRLVPADITMQAQNLGITYDQPIMPPAQLDFAVATTINNCGVAEVKQTIGKADTRSTTINTKTEESFSITTQHKASVDMSLSMGVSADLFGVAGMERNLTFSVGYEYTNTQMTTNVFGFDTSKTITTEVSVQREITIPPHTSLDAYDAVQTYRNVVVLYVQKIRLTGERNGVSLTGDEIVSQLVANQFGGVVTEIGDSYVTITVRGKVNIENLMAAQTDVKTKPCGG